MSEQEDFEFRLRFEQEQGDELRLGNLPPETSEPSTDGLFKFQKESGILKGMTDPAAGAAQLLTRITPPSLRGVKPEDIDPGIARREKQYQGRRKAEGEEGMDWARVGGNIISPASIALMQAKIPATLAGRFKQGAAIGGAYGASQPVTDDKADYASAKALQAGTGVATGGAIPLVGATVRSGGRYLDEFTKPFTKKGQTRDVIKFIQENIGSGKEKIVNALQKAKEIVPGNRPTSGQAIAQANRATKSAAKKQLQSSIDYINKLGLTGDAKEAALKMAREGVETVDDFGGHIVKLEKDLMKVASSGDKLKSRMSQQAVRREQALGVGDDETINAALAQTAAKSKAGYEKAWSHKVDYDPELGGIMNNQFIQDVMPDVVKSAKFGKIPVDPKTDMTQFLHKVKIALDDKLKATTGTGEKAVIGQNRADIKAIKNKLVEWIEVKNPLYKEARVTHAAAMKEINSMQLSKLNKEALINAAGDETGATFATAVRKAPASIKRATGTGFAKTAEEVQGPIQAKANKEVVDEIMNQAKYKKMATESEAIMPKLSGEVEFSLPHILSRPVVVANTILKKIGQDKSPEYKKILSDILESPAEFERILKLPASNPKVKMAMDIMNKLSTSGMTQPAARGVQQ